jgi:hypothetical protein
VRVRRDGRSLEAPVGKPVVLLDQDRFEVAGKRVRVHVHGRAPAVVPPSPLPETSPSSFPKAAAAVVALGAALGAADCKKGAEQAVDIEVRTSPPKIEVPTPDVVPSAADVGPGPLTVDAASPDSEPIEIRVAPPMVAPDPLPREPVPTDTDAGAAAQDVPPAPQDAAAQPQHALPEPQDAAAAEDAQRRHRRDAGEPIEVRERPPDMIMK